MWELIVSNIVTACVIGGGVMMYHCYVEYKKQQYINELTEKARDISVTLMQLGFYMMMMKGTSDINQIMKILGNNKHIKNNIPEYVFDNMPTIFNMYGMCDPSANLYCSSDKPFMKPMNTHHNAFNNPNFVCEPMYKNKSKSNQKEQYNIDDFGNISDFSDIDSMDEI